MNATYLDFSNVPSRPVSHHPEERGFASLAPITGLDKQPDILSALNYKWELTCVLKGLQSIEIGTWSGNIPTLLLG